MNPILAATSLLEPIDWTLIGLYFLIIVGIVYWSSRKVQNTQDYFLRRSKIRLDSRPLTPACPP